MTLYQDPMFMEKCGINTYPGVYFETDIFIGQYVLNFWNHNKNLFCILFAGFTELWWLIIYSTFFSDVNLVIMYSFEWRTFMLLSIFENQGIHFVTVNQTLHKKTFSYRTHSKFNERTDMLEICIFIIPR